MEPVPNRAPNPDTSHHEVQVRKGKSKWETRYSSTGGGLKAMHFYQSVNVGNGYRKRFVVDGKTVHTTTS